MFVNETGGKFLKFLLFSRHVTFEVKHATLTSNMQQLTLNMKPIIFYVKHATDHVKYATLMSNIKQARIFRNILYFGFIQDMQHLTPNMQAERWICKNGR